MPGEPGCYFDEGVEVYSCVVAHVVQEVDEVFCGDVARGAGGERAAARAADGGIEHCRAALDGGCGVGYSCVACVVKVAGDGSSRSLTRSRTNFCAARANNVPGY